MLMTELDEKSFAEFVKSAPVVLVDFYATWCGPCRILSTTLSKFTETQDEVPVGQVNIDSADSLVEEFGIKSVPTMLIFKDGMLVKTLSGAKFRIADIEQQLNEVKEQLPSD